MADRNDPTHTTHTTSTGRTTATDRTTTNYRDPRVTNTTTTTEPRRGRSWIGIVIALLAIAVIAAWWAGGFGDGEETAMMVGEPATEGEVLNEGAVGGDVETTTVPVDEDPAAAPATDTPPAPAEPAPQ